MLCICCIYFLFITCVLWQHYLCWTYTVPTIHVNDAMHTIPIIHIIHIIHTIHMKCNYHTYHTYNSIHTIAYIQYQPLMPYIPYHTYQTYHTFQTCHTRPTIHTIHTHHTIPHPHHTTGGGGGQCHTPTTPQGGEGEDLIWDQYMGPIPYGGGKGGVAGPGAYIYCIN